MLVSGRAVNMPECSRWTDNVALYKLEKVVYNNRRETPATGLIFICGFPRPPVVRDTL